MKRRMLISHEFATSSWSDTPNQAAVGWKCSTCGKLITRIEHGRVEWLASEDEPGTTRLKGLRLVHQLSAGPRGRKGYGCQYDKRYEFKKDRSVVEGLALGRFVGPDGLMLLFSFMAENELPANDILELAKRVQIPGYEQARDLFQTAVTLGVLKPSIGVGYYLQSEIRALLRWATNKVG